MSLDRSPVRKIVLNEPELEKLPIAAGMAQGGIFALIFSIVDQVLKSSYLKYILFPAAWLFSVYQVIRNTREFYREKNKSLGKILSITTDWLCLIAETTAITLAFAAFTAVAGFVVPLIFASMLAIKFISHLGQTLYHLGHALASESGTKKNEYHWKECKNNFKATLTLGVALAAVSLLMLFPPLHIVAFGVATIAAIQIAAGSSMGGLNLLFGGYGLWKTHNQQQKMELQKKADKADKPSVQAKPNPNSKDPQKELLLGSSKDEEKSALKKSVALDSPVFEKNNKEMEKGNVDDLIAKMEASNDQDGPQTLIQGWFDEARMALENDLGYWKQGRNIEEEEKEADDSSVEKAPRAYLDTNGNLDLSKVGNRLPSWYPQVQLRQDKLQAVLLLEDLIKKMSDGNNSAPFVMVDKAQFSTVKNLMDYFLGQKASGEKENIYTSLSNSVGRIQKLFVLAEYYESHPRLYPQNRKNMTQVDDYCAPDPDLRRSGSRSQLC